MTLDDLLHPGPVNVGEAERWLSVAGGTALAVAGLRRGSAGGALLALAGAALVHRGATGHCMAYGTLGMNTAGGDAAQAAPSGGGTLRAAGAGPADRPEFDIVDEESDESFPASDPPSWSGSHAGAPPHPGT